VTPSKVATPPTEGEQHFWAIAEELLHQPRVTRSTMMGFPCLRVAGAFFACCDKRTGALVVKLAEDHVDRLVASGRGEAFAPAGKRFREWIAIPYERRRSWRRMLDDALAFVQSA
jgi:hypothetical protein